MGEARNIKWVAPGVLFAVCMWAASVVAGMWLSAGVVVGFVGGLFAVLAVGNYYDYRMGIWAAWLERRQRALSITPFAAEMESARGVHPDAAALIVNERHRVWMLKSGQPAEGIPPHAVLFEAPLVTDIFLLYFLQNSGKKSILPKRLLVEGRKSRFDPLKQVDEYVMYNNLVELLEKKGMIRKYNEFQVHEFVAPWEPRYIAENFGLTWEEPAKADDEKNLLKENQ